MLSVGRLPVKRLAGLPTAAAEEALGGSCGGAPGVLKYVQLFHVKGVHE